MDYEKLIHAFGLAYLRGPVSRTFVGDRFCMVDNFLSGNACEDVSGSGLGIACEEKSDSKGCSLLREAEPKPDIKFPIKITLGFCLYCKSGRISARVQQSDYIVTAGGVLVIFAGNILESVSLSDDCRLIYIAIDSDYMMTGIRSRYGRALRQWILRSTRPTLLYPKADDVENFERLCDCVKHIVDSGGWNKDSVAEGGSGDTETTERERTVLIGTGFGNYSDGVLAGFTSIYGNLLLNWAESAAVASSGNLTGQETVADRVLYRFRDDVHNFATKYRSVEYYARRQNLSTRHFSRLISQASGRKAHEIIREYIILEAKSLLVTGRYSVREVADMLGFQNYSFFNRYFSSAVGKTPGEYLN